MTNTIETNIRFSASRLWRDQKKYYDEKGIDAWEDDVPFYITSNPFIARAYAETAISFMQDWLQQEKNNAVGAEPFYILELGSGTGQFSFYFLKSFLEIQKTLQLEHIRIRYVMSDVTSKSFDFWEKHAAFQPYLVAGILDFAVLDLYDANNILLHRAQKNLADIKHPLIIIANYLFDSIATDVFTVEDGKLYESKVTVKMPEGAENLKKAKVSYREFPIKDNYYHNKFDTLLFAYEKKLIDTHFQFPIASLQALNQLKSLSQNRFLLLTSDKGCARIEELDHSDYPELDFHGSFSVMMNYHALGEFVKQHNGDFYVQAFREHIVSGVYAFGFTIAHFPQTQWRIKQMIHGFSPTDYFILYESFIARYKKFTLEETSSYLNLSNWDPYLFSELEGKLCDLAGEGEADVVSYLAEHMHLIADNFYYLPSAEDVFFSIGVFFQNIGRFFDAMKYYERSVQFFGEDDITLYNMGMCAHSLGDKNKAVAFLESAK